MSGGQRSVAGPWATWRAVTEQLGRIERLLTSGVVESVRALSVDEVVRLTGAPRKAVLAAIRSGDLPSIPVGERTRLVRPADLDAWLEHLERYGPPHPS